MDKAPDAAAICIGALPFSVSLCFARTGSSSVIAYNSVEKWCMHNSTDIVTCMRSPQ